MDEETKEFWQAERARLPDERYALYLKFQEANNDHFVRDRITTEMREKTDEIDRITKLLGDEV